MNRYRIREASYLPSSRPQITAICDVITSIPPMVSRESPGKMGRREIITHYETNPRPSPWTNDPATTHRARSQCEEVLGLTLADVAGTAGYLVAGDLPSFGPYLIAKYPELSEAAMTELTRRFKELRAISRDAADWKGSGG